MPRTSLFRFKGELRPKDLIPRVNARYSLERPSGSFGIEIDGHDVTIEFVASYESFDDLYFETYEFALAFFAVGSINLGRPIELILHEWIEHPLKEEGRENELRPVRGTILHEDPDATPPMIMQDRFMFGLAQGLLWSQDIATNSFLRRAVLDFNFALDHPLQDIPIYLARAIESVQVFFGKEKELKSALHVSSELTKVKRIANDALSGFHTRHAAKTEQIRPLTREEVLEAVEATRQVLTKFQMYLMGNRLQAQNQPD